MNNRNNAPMLNLKSINNIRKSRLNQLAYSPEQGFFVHFDSVTNLPKGQFSQAKIVYAVFNQDDMILGNK